MENLFLIFGITFGFFFGVIGAMKYINKQEKKRIKEEKKKIQTRFLESYVELNRGNSEFKSRTMNTCYIKTKIPSEGHIELLYLIDKDDLAIVKNNEVIYTSHKVDDSVIKETVDFIKKEFKKDINDTINIFGLMFSKKSFEKAMGMKIDSFEDLISKMYGGNNSNSLSGYRDLRDDIIRESEPNDEYDINDIFDKINKEGMDSLSKKEIAFLEYYSNNL